MTGQEEKVGYYAGVMVSCLYPVLACFHTEKLINHQEFTRQALSLVTVMFWSRLSDHIGRKPILLLGTVALAVSMISFGLSTVFWALVLRHGLHCRYTPPPCNITSTADVFSPGSIATPVCFSQARHLLS